VSNAAIVSHTPITDFMDMTIFRFAEFFRAIGDVMEKLADKRDQGR